MRVADPWTFDGFSAIDIASLVGLPRVELIEETTSTLDVAHRLAAEGSGAGTLVVSDRQTAGRGRGANVWISPAGTGIWMALIARPASSSEVDVLSLRVGLKAARALDRFAAEPVRVKWPNDLYVEGRKLGGTLIEARWRDGRIEWVAIGVGINVSICPGLPAAAALDPGTSRIEVLTDLVPAISAAAACSGPLSPLELAEWDTRDMARGRSCSEPARGVVRGITAHGELLIALADSVARFRSGSLVLDQIT